ncbi:glycosyltransferase [Falsiroseomonas oryzae]|uniref:glycosyltransferase n=1 Tax=Falsiroseomonas oryzae TaxID=2766473 RepID=UPI0022EB43A2|nr:glycosyltransferase [Roseomonas sp. MO-31]
MTAPTRPRTVLIVEPHLEGRAGHPWLYAGAFVGRFAQCGWAARILAHRDYRGPPEVGGMRVEPVFPRSYYEVQDRKPPILRHARTLQRQAARGLNAATAVSRRLRLLVEPPPVARLVNRVARTRAAQRVRALLRRVARHVGRAITAAARFGSLGLAGVIGALPFGIAYVSVQFVGRPATRETLSPFARIVLDAVRQQDRVSADLAVLVPTATPGLLSELLALPALLGGPLPRIALVFHEEPEYYKQWYRPLDLEILAARLQGSGWGSSLRCYATTKRLSDKMSGLLGLPVQPIGDVFEPAHVERLAAAVRGEPGELTAFEASLFADLRRRRAAGQRIAVCPGAVRHDKGEAALPALMEALARVSDRYHIVLQAPRTPHDLRERVLALGTTPGVTVLSEDLSEAGYAALLGQADVVLLPYDPVSYARRVSRVFLEAALAGKPIVASAGMAVEDEAAGVAVRFVDAWDRWTDAADALLQDGGASLALLGARRREAAQNDWMRWHGIVDWLTRPAPRVRAPKPVLYVRPSWFASGSATVFDQHLRHLARRGLPTVEVVLDPDCSARARNEIWRQVLDDRACSPAPLTAWSSPRSGVAGLAQAANMLRTLRGSSYARQLAESRRTCPLPPAVQQIVRQQGFALVLVNHYFHEPFVAALRGQAPLWIETHDVQARQMVIRGARNLITGRQDPFERMLADELSYLERADVVGAINVEEAAFLRTRLGKEGWRVLLCQPAVTLAPPQEAVPPCDVLIVASDNPTNVRNVRWFVREVLPCLPNPRPRVRVVGTIGWIANREDLLADDVEFVGPVRDLAAQYASAALVALPVTVGAGIAIKGLEALAAGKAVVATPLAFRGLPEHFRPPCRLTDDPARFAGQIARLLADEAERRSAAAATRTAHESLGMTKRFASQMDEALMRLANVPQRCR